MLLPHNSDIVGMSDPEFNSREECSDTNDSIYRPLLKGRNNLIRSISESNKTCFRETDGSHLENKLSINEKSDDSTQHATPNKNKDKIIKDSLIEKHNSHDHCESNNIKMDIMNTSNSPHTNVYEKIESIYDEKQSSDSSTYTDSVSSILQPDTITKTDSKKQESVKNIPNSFDYFKNFKPINSVFNPSTYQQMKQSGYEEIDLDQNSFSIQQQPDQLSSHKKTLIFILFLSGFLLFCIPVIIAFVILLLSLIPVIILLSLVFFSTNPKNNIGQLINLNLLTSKIRDYMKNLFKPKAYNGNSKRKNNIKRKQVHNSVSNIFSARCNEEQLNSVYNGEVMGSTIWNKDKSTNLFDTDFISIVLLNPLMYITVIPIFCCIPIAIIASLPFFLAFPWIVLLCIPFISCVTFICLIDMLRFLPWEKYSQHVSNYWNNLHKKCFSQSKSK